MDTNKRSGWLGKLLRPSTSYSVLALLVIGGLLGVVAVIAFDTTLHATSTEEFCISCHEMKAHPYAQLQETAHYSNAYGVQATCSDCHVPKEFVPKMIRKVEAAREVWGTITGVIDTPEKYAAHTPVMKAREIARLQANDSQECRNCHKTEHMRSDLQSKMAQRFHQPKRMQDKTCIDCHAGIAHPQD
ncbi:Denitrification system component NirT [Halioglobus japonicus]|nr:Denitrification system component NirT [Halioglobus japonicus]